MGSRGGDCRRCAWRSRRCGTGHYRGAEHRRSGGGHRHDWRCDLRRARYDVRYCRCRYQRSNCRYRRPDKPIGLERLHQLAASWRAGVTRRGCRIRWREDGRRCFRSDGQSWFERKCLWCGADRPVSRRSSLEWSHCWRELYRSAFITWRFLIHE